MAVRIANLKILVSANTTGLSSGFSKAKTKVSGFRGTLTTLKAGISRAVPIIATLTAGLASFATIAALARRATQEIIRQFSELDKLGKTASKLGVATDALQKMRFAGKLTGVEVTTMDMALQRWTKNLSKAATGSKELEKIFVELGIDAKELARLPFDEQMLRFADAMEGVATQGDRVRLAAALLDSEGVGLVGTLKGGSEALDKLFKERAELGLFSPQQVAQIESANDSMTKLGIQVNFVAGAIASELSPVIDELTKRFVEAGKEGEFNFGKITDGIKLFATVAALAVDAVDGLNEAVQFNAMRARFFEGTIRNIDRLLQLDLGFDFPAANAVTEVFEAARENSEAIAENLSPGPVDGIWGSNNFTVNGSLDSGLNAAITALPAALEKGSAAAFSFSAKAGEARGISSIVKWTQETAEESAEQTAILTRIEANLATPAGAADL